MASEAEELQIQREGAWADQLSSHRAYNDLLIAEVERRIANLVDRITGGKPMDHEQYVQSVGELRAWRDVTRIVDAARDKRNALIDNKQGRA